MADTAPRPSRRRDLLGDYLVLGYLIGLSLTRALFFTGMAIALFLLAFLGYFTVSFLFLGGALLLLASSSARRAYRRASRRSRLR